MSAISGKEDLPATVAGNPDVPTTVSSAAAMSPYEGPDFVANAGGVGVIAGAMAGITEKDVATNGLAANCRALAREMRDEELPEAVVETILTGRWTTCLEILPGNDDAVGLFALVFLGAFDHPVHGLLDGLGVFAL